MSQMFSLIGEYAGVYGALIIGQSANTEEELLFNSPHGIVGPRTENFVVKDVNFWNLDWNEAAGFGTCSHCEHPATEDRGSYTYKTEGLTFNNVQQKIRHEVPWNFIFHD